MTSPMEVVPQCPLGRQPRNQAERARVRGDWWWIQSHSAQRATHYWCKFRALIVMCWWRGSSHFFHQIAPDVCLFRTRRDREVVVVQDIKHVHDGDEDAAEVRAVLLV